MRKEKSWTRIQYEACYRYMRRGFNVHYLRKSGDRTQEVIQAADYSYQAKDHYLDAWASSQRRKRFYAIKHRYDAAADGIPF